MLFIWACVLFEDARSAHLLPTSAAVDDRSHVGRVGQSQNSTIRVGGFALSEQFAWKRGPIEFKQELEGNGAMWRRAEEVGELVQDAINWIGSNGTAADSGKIVEWLRLEALRNEEPGMGEREASDIAEAVKQEIRFVARAYMDNALGCDEIAPISGRCKRTMGIAVTALDSLSTLHLAGLEDEFDRMATWVTEKLRIENRGQQSVFETTIRAIGGLASAHSLSGHEGLKKRLVEFAKDILPAFNTPTGIPKGRINLVTAETDYLPWLHLMTTLADAGSLGMEMRYVTQVTGDNRFEDAIDRVSRALWKSNSADRRAASRLRGLLGSNVADVETSTPSTSGYFSLGGASDSYYEYLLKQYLQTGKTQSNLRDEWVEAMNQMIDELVRVSPGGDLYVGSRYGHPSGGHDFGMQPSMEHLTCFVPGMLELGYNTLENPNKTWHDTAVALTRTCHKMYIMTNSGVSPEASRFDQQQVLVQRKEYFLRPEVAESVFYLWYFTKEDKYRRMAADIFKGIKKLKSKYGFSETSDVTRDPPPLMDTMQSYFISETLMYLYMTFAPHGTIDLHKQVFTTEGHPLPRSSWQARKE